jgi:hypothetical protein
MPPFAAPLAQTPLDIREIAFTGLDLRRNAELVTIS